MGGRSCFITSGAFGDTLVSRRLKGRDIRDRERDRDQSMLRKINKYGSIVAILARFAFNFDIQVQQL